MMSQVTAVRVTLAVHLSSRLSPCAVKGHPSGAVRMLSRYGTQQTRASHGLAAPQLRQPCLATPAHYGLNLNASSRRQALNVVAMAKKLIALDFDGVVCDSCGESSISAFKAAAIQWPEIFTSHAALARKDELMDKMRHVRPVVETGYENIVQIRALYEGMGVEEMLDGWGHILPKLMQQWGLERAPLVQLFGDVRDQWIAEDLEGWLAPNRIYGGVAEPVGQAMGTHEVYIVTTKMAHYTEILMRDMARVPFPPERIFSQTVSGRPKGEVLTSLAEKHTDVEKCIFVEDKLSTLEKVCLDPGLSHWQLYLVDWGYNTPRERERAASNPRIKVINVQQFTELLTGQ